MRIFICLLLALALAATPVMGQSNAVTQEVTIVITVPPFGQAELPDYLPIEVQKQIQILVEAERENLLSLSQLFVTVVFVVVVGIIIYCLWRCAQAIPVPAPNPPPDDPALAGMPNAVLYNLEPATSRELQSCVDINSPEWTPLCTLAGSTNLSGPKSDRMFFRIK